MAKSPTAMMAMSMPVERGRRLKVSRSWPVTGSSPTRPSVRPMARPAASNQEDLDRVFGLRPGPPGRSPKSISAETVNLVEGILREATGGISASECAQASGLSRVSARRYLEYLAEKGRATVQLRYATAGRPERRYHWARPARGRFGTTAGSTKQPHMPAGPEPASLDPQFRVSELPRMGPGRAGSVATVS